jgi:thiamine transport system ATP-binding protein
MLLVDDLTVRFGNTVAVDHVHLEVGDGEVVGVLGPSGSGKSTLLRTIAGLETPVSGRISRDDTDLRRLAPHQRALGLMFQDHQLFPHRDVLGNTMFGLRMRHASRRDAEERARAVLDLVGLGGFEHRSVGDLSGGEQQRVALARALAPEPRLLMLDEPLGSLDRRLREQLLDELRDLFTRLALSVLFVTHDHDEAFALAERVAVMHDGRLEQTGAPRDVWTHPATAFVARFVGWNLTTALGDEMMAVRPDALSLAPDGPLVGHVVGQSFRRDHQRLRVALDGSGDVLEVTVPHEALLPKIGESVRLAADPSGIRALPEQ